MVHSNTFAGFTTVFDLISTIGEFTNYNGIHIYIYIYIERQTDSMKEGTDT